MPYYDDDPDELLTVRYSPDSDGTGELHVTAATRGFAGASSAWFDTTSLTRFAESLSQYPLPEGDPRSIWSGFGANERTGEPAQEHVKISVEPVGNRGQVRVQVRLATPRWTTDGPTVPYQTAELDLLTTYERLRHFSDHMVMAIRGELDEATLGTEVLA